MSHALLALTVVSGASTSNLYVDANRVFVLSNDVDAEGAAVTSLFLPNDKTTVQGDQLSAVQTARTNRALGVFEEQNTGSAAVLIWLDVNEIIATTSIAATATQGSATGVIFPDNTILLLEGDQITRINALRADPTLV